MAPFACISWFYMVLSPLTKLPFGSCAIYSNADVYFLILYLALVWSLQGRVFDFAVTDVLFLVWLMISLRRPSAAACACLVRWQLMHRWPGASAQFEHLWGQRIGILSMYDSRANGLMRLLGMKLPSPGCWSSAWSCSGSLETRESRVDFHSLSWKGEAIPRCRFVMNFSCVWFALRVDDGSLFGLCVLSAHLCHEASVL